MLDWIFRVPAGKQTRSAHAQLFPNPVHYPVRSSRSSASLLLHNISLFAQFTLGQGDFGTNLILLTASIRLTLLSL